MGDANDAFMRNQSANNVQARTKAQNRATVLQLKLIGQSHPTGLTPNLLKLFEPRPPLEFKPPPEKRKCPSYSGMAQFVCHFAEPGEAEYSPPVVKGETPLQKRARINRLRLEKGAEKAAEDLQNYDPSKDPNVTGDPYKTLFVARLNYETTEHRIKREFETYGPIKRGIVMYSTSGNPPIRLAFCQFDCNGDDILRGEAVHLKVRLITDKETSKPRGYAFIEYMHTRDMKTAYKQADGRKLDNRRVLVDVERGRTVANWRPRRLGGGLGSTRVGGEDLNQKYSGREPQQLASGGPPRPEEPRGRDDRHQDREREKSRDRGREREKEHDKSREWSHDRLRDRDSREERHHHRDRDRNRDRERERDRGRDRDRTRDRDRDRDRGRDNDRDRDRPRERERDRERDYDRGSHDADRSRARERQIDYDNIEQKPNWEEHGERERGYNYEPEHGQDWYEEPASRGRKYEDYEHAQCENLESDRGISKRHGHEDDRGGYDQMETDGYRGPYDRADNDPHGKEMALDRDYEYQRTERSLSREYEL